MGKNKLWLARTRLTKFNCTYTSYTIPISRVVAHEMGHCLGLNRTNTPPYGNGDNDGLSDTPLDFSDKDGCVNPSTCQFAGIQPPNSPGVRHVMNVVRQATHKRPLSRMLGLAPGQSVNVGVTATNACGTSNRTIAFAAYSSYKVFPNPAKSTVYIEFDNIEKPICYPKPFS